MTFTAVKKDSDSEKQLNEIVQATLEEEEEENLKDYGPGGYHSVSIGDRFKSDRYKIIRKLGWGHFSTVWLSFDSTLKKYVALKIVKSGKHYRETAFDEIDLLKKISSNLSSHVGKKYVIHILDHFVHTGPNGLHVCMVFELLGENLLGLIRTYKYRGIPLILLKQIVKQVMLGLDYLHRECGIIHTDIKPENILICVDQHHSDLVFPPDDDLLIPEKKDIKCVMASQPFKNQIKQILQSDKLSELCDGLKIDDKNNNYIIEVKIADLGNACWVTKHFTNDIQTRPYRAPEVILGASWGASADCWSLACLVFELFTGDYLFDPKRGSRFSKDDDHMAQIIELLGNISKNFAMSGSRSYEIFNKKGDLRRIQKLKFWSLRDVLEEKYNFSATEAEQLTSFLLPLLDCNPQKRATAGAMVNHVWLKDAFFKEKNDSTVWDSNGIPGWASPVHKSDH